MFDDCFEKIKPGWLVEEKKPTIDGSIEFTNFPSFIISIVKLRRIGDANFLNNLVKGSSSKGLRYSIAFPSLKI